MSSENPETAPTTAPKAEESVAAPKEAAAATTTSDEPQNELTKKFTAEEWEGVKTLRGKLPDIAADVNSDKDKAISLWGVDISSHSAKSNVVLVKFIRARPGNVAAAQEMLLNTLKWRRDFKADELKSETFPDDIFGKVGKISGKDKEGRPVTYNFYGSTDPNVVFKDVDQFLRWRVKLMEEGIALIDFETVDSMVQVHDYDGVSLFGGRTPNSKLAAKQASQIFSDYYPEFLYKKFFVSVPTILTWIFWTFTSVLSPATQSKMSVVGSGPETISQALLPIIDKSQLPKRYSGEGSDI